jgi:nucleolar protein 56
MAHSIYSSCIGTFVFSDKKLVEERLFNNSEILTFNPMLEQKKEIEPETTFAKKYPGEIIKKDVPSWVLDFFNQKNYLEKIKSATLLYTKRKIAESLRPEYLLIQAINNIDEIDKVANNLGKRLREWYELYNPEFSKSIEDHEKFAEIIQQKSRQELLQEVGITEAESMGAEISKKDLEPVMKLAKELSSLFVLRANQVEYIEQGMKEQLPNVNAMCGAMIGAKLLAVAGSLEKLALFPASTIQLLGAEKALFRHMKTGAKPPKFGIIINHPIVMRTKQGDKGKSARMLADKISIAAKIDFFKGEFRGDSLRTEVEAKFK